MQYVTDIDGGQAMCETYHDITRCVTDTPRYRAVCDGPRDNLVVTDTQRYITPFVTDIDGGQVVCERYHDITQCVMDTPRYRAVCDRQRDNPVVTDIPRYITL